MADDYSSWSRQRKMPLHDMITCILAKKDLSTVMELRHYCQEADKAEQMVSKQDYFKQRLNLNPQVFKILNWNYLERYYSGQEAKEWNGYLVMAIDGSRAEIPNSKENRQAYGANINQSKHQVARTNISGLVDVFNGFILDVGIHHYKDSEIEAARAHIEALKKAVGDRPVLIMFDRNYASLEFMHFLEKSGVKYLIRLHEKNFKDERENMRSADEEVEIIHTSNRLRHIRAKYPQQAQELACKKSSKARIIKTKFENGDAAAFVTNLYERTLGEIRHLYKKRWSIEQKYHTLKNKMKFESVTGKASVYVKQDFWAQMLVFNMARDLITSAERRAAKKSKERGHKYKIRINENIAIGLFKERFIKLVMEEDDIAKAAMFRRLICDRQNLINQTVPDL